MLLLTIVQSLCHMVICRFTCNCSSKGKIGQISMPWASVSIVHLNTECCKFGFCCKLSPGIDLVTWWSGWNTHSGMGEGCRTAGFGYALSLVDSIVPACLLCSLLRHQGYLSSAYWIFWVALAVNWIYQTKLYTWFKTSACAYFLWSLHLEEM